MVHPPGFLPTVEKVPAFDATKKFYQRVGSLEDVKFSSNPTGVVFWVEKISNGFFLGCPFFFGGGGKTGGEREETALCGKELGEVMMEVSMKAFVVSTVLNTTHEPGPLRKPPFFTH